MGNLKVLIEDTQRDTDTDSPCLIRGGGARSRRGGLLSKREGGGCQEPGAPLASDQSREDHSEGLAWPLGGCWELGPRAGLGSLEQRSGRLQVRSLRALLGGQAGVKSGFLLGVLAGLGGGLDGSLGRCLEAEVGALAHALCSRRSGAV